MLLVVALTLPAGTALAGGNVTTRLDGVWDCVAANDMTVVGVGPVILAEGTCVSGTSMIEWETTFPTSSKASDKSVSADQKNFLNVVFSDSATAESGTGLVEKCKGKGEFKAKNSEGKGDVNCSMGQSLGTTPPLSNTTIANLLVNFAKKNGTDCELTDKGKLKIKHKKGVCTVAP
jgi:hypothetical protein